MRSSRPDAVVKATAAAIEAAGVPRRLLDGPAVVLERIARGAGATRWYWLESIHSLDRLCARLYPGSVVNFYFDDRIQRKILDDDVEDEILDLAVRHGEALVGRLEEDGLEIAVDLVCAADELWEAISTYPARTQVFFGTFPGNDDDGVNAITMRLPDADGVVRRHPV
jgi:hypothetical protein